MQRGRQPHAVAQVHGFLHVDPGEAGERHPVVAAVDHGLDHGAQARVGVGQPFEAFAVDQARACRGFVKSLGGELVAAGDQRLDQQGQPLLGLAEDHRRALALEHGLADQLAAQRVADHLAHGAGIALHVGDHVELGVGAFPLAEHAQELGHEDAQLHLGRRGLDGGRQLGERFLGLAGADQAFGGGEGFGGHVGNPLRELTD